MTAKITTMITRMSHSEAIVRTEPIVDAFTKGNPIQGPMPSFIVVGEELKGVHDRFKDVHREAETGNHTSVAERNALRTPFNQVFIDLTDFIELASRKDPTLPYRAGCEYFWHKKNSTTRLAATATPTLTMDNTHERGVVSGKVTPVAGAKSYLMEYTYGDPTVESNWSHLAVHATASKMISRNLEAGRTCSFRVRAVGTNGTGPWSNYVTLIIT